MLFLRRNNSIGTMFLRLSHTSCLNKLLIESSWKHLTKYFQSNLIYNENFCICTLKKHVYVLNVMHCNNYTTAFNPHNKDVKQEKDNETNLDSFKDKILFNSVFESELMKHSWLKKKIMKEKAIRKEHEKSCEIHDFPIALKYLAGVDLKQTGVASETQQDTENENQTVNLPYTIQYKEKIHEKLDMNNTSKTLPEVNVHTGTPPSVEKCVEEDDLQVNRTLDNKGKRSLSWMKDYEQFDDSELRYDEGEGVEEQWELNYGSPNSSVPVSNTPCGGCGALLHCQDTAIPGYLPSELFVGRGKEELRAMTCQRCHFMLHYNMALNVSVPHGEYPRLLAQIKDKRALAILMVDVTDFPCSLWPGILDIIGTKRPVVVVGNKIDLLPQDSSGFLDHIRSSLTDGLGRTGISAANVKHVALISAKTGFGVEELITKLHNIWMYQGDVFLLGCTNVGKSTLFNALLQSDYCKVKAVDLLQRATTSPWPGTTLNLLKFPILRPSGWRQYERTQRLLSQRAERQAEAEHRGQQLRKTKSPQHATLIGHIGRTFLPADPIRLDSDPFSVNVLSHGGPTAPPRGLDPADPNFAQSMWCYDTPGTVHPDQILDLLTTEELMLTIPKKLLMPRTFNFHDGMTLFIGGLARLDYIEGPRAIRLTVFAADSLPLTVCRTMDAEQLHKELAGSELTGVPCGDAARLALWPGLSPHPDTIQVTGLNWRQSCADVVLSSAGWVAVTPRSELRCSFRAWTPESRGVHVRRPSFLQYSVNLRGTRIRHSPAYRRGTTVYIKH